MNPLRAMKAFFLREYAFPPGRNGTGGVDLKLSKLRQHRTLGHLSKSVKAHLLNSSSFEKTSRKAFHLKRYLSFDHFVG